MYSFLFRKLSIVSTFVVAFMQYCTVPEPQARSLEILRGGWIPKAKILKGEFEAKLVILGRGVQPKYFSGGGMDIIWNHAL